MSFVALSVALLALAPARRVAGARGAAQPARNTRGAAQASASVAEPLRFDLPAGGEVRVENRLGGVRVETWAERFLEIDVAAEGDAAEAGKASPVRAEQTQQLLSVTVAHPARPAASRRTARAASAATPRVELTLRVPAAARLTVFTNDGAIDVRGQTAGLDAQTVAGDLRLELPPRPDADVMARALGGTITVRAGAAGSSVERTVRERFQARLGAGRSVVRLTSVRGRIELAAPDARAQAPGAAAREPSRAATRALRDRSPDASAATPRETPVAPPGGDGARRGEDEARGSGTRARDTAGARPNDAPGARAGDAATGRAVDGRAVDGAGVGAADAPPARRRLPTLVGAKGEEGRAASGAQGSTNASAASPGAPSPGAPLEVDPEEVITVDTHVVTLNLSVVDRKSGRGMAGLAREDFRVFEDNVEQQLMNFESTNAPFDLLLLVDLSGSTAKVTDVIRAACLRFVESVRPHDRVGVVAFAGTHAVVSPLTDDRRLLRARLAQMGPPTGDTKLYDALDFSLDYVEAQSPKSRRRAVVVLSDGLDSVLPNVQGEGSALAYDDLRRRVQEFDGLLYTVWTDNTYDALSPLDIQPETFDLVYDRMEELAAQGGGVFYEVEKLDDLAGVYGRVVQDLGTVYSLTYLPANKTRDGRWRSVKVRLPRRPEAVARGRSGYYAK